MSEQWAPCPHCKNERIVLLGNALTPLMGAAVADCYCQKCGAKAPQSVWNTRASQPALAQGDELFARRLQQLRDYAQWEKDHTGTDKQHILDWAVSALSAQREQPKCLHNSRSSQVGYPQSGESAQWTCMDCGADVTEQPQGVVVPSDEQIEVMAHRMCSRYRHGENLAYAFERHTLIDFARALLGQHTNNTNQEPQP